MTDVLLHGFGQRFDLRVNHAAVITDRTTPSQMKSAEGPPVRSPFMNTLV